MGCIPISPFLVPCSVYEPYNGNIPTSLTRLIQCKCSDCRSSLAGTSTHPFWSRVGGRGTPICLLFSNFEARLFLVLHLLNMTLKVCLHVTSKFSIVSMVTVSLTDRTCLELIYPVW